MTLSKDPTSGIYRALFRRKGQQPLKLSLRTTRKGEAQSTYAAVRLLWRENNADVIAQLRSGKLSVERAAAMVRDNEKRVAVVESVAGWPSVDEAVRRFLAYLDAHPNLAVATGERTKSHLELHFAEATYVAPDAAAGTVPVRLGDLQLDHVTVDMISSLVRHMRNEGISENTIATRLSRIYALYNWIEREEQRQAREARRAARVLYKPFDKALHRAEPQPRDRWLAEDEASTVMAATPDPLLPIVGLGLLAGLRLGEVLHLQPSDVDLDLGVITVRRRKPCPGCKAGVWKTKTARSARVVPIAAALRPLLERQLASLPEGAAWLFPKPTNPDHPYLIRNFEYHFTAIVLRAGLVAGIADARGVVFHSLRHTFASWLVMRGVDLYTVAQLLGDSLTTTEKTYAHLSPDVKRRAIAKLDGALEVPVLESAETATAPGEAAGGGGNDTSSDTNGGN